MTILVSRLTNDLVKHLVKVRDKSDYRKLCNTVIVEGPHIFDELSSVLRIKTLLVLENTEIPACLSPEQSCYVTPDVMKKISATVSPPKILAEVFRPVNQSLFGLNKIIAFDNVSDPGNMGTLLRSALALGWDGAFILNDSVDPFNDKALRAAKGATFQLPIRKGSWEELMNLIELNQLQPILADVKGAGINSIPLKKSILLVVGNEAKGASDQAIKISTAVSIPMKNNMESLNVGVAGSILMHELKNHEK